MTTHINDSGTWRTLNNIYVNDVGNWRRLSDAFVNDSGTWRRIFSAYEITLGGVSNETNTQWIGYSDNSFLILTPFGSLLQNTAFGGTFALFADVYTFPDGNFIQNELVITVGSNPGQNAFASLVVDNGSDQTLLSSAASYTYSSGRARWVWGGGSPVFTPISEPPAATLPFRFT